MKTILSILFALAAFAATAQEVRTVLIEWNYPTNSFSPNMTFYVMSSTNLSVPLTNWVALTNTAGTNTACSVNMIAEQRYFYVAASNFWGMSLPSNIAATPNPARGDWLSDLKIYRVK